MEPEVPTEEQVARLEREVAEVEQQLKATERAIRATVVETMAAASADQFEAPLHTMQAERAEGMGAVAGFVFGAAVGVGVCFLLLALLRGLGIK
jgi:hypothetical protein